MCSALLILSNCQRALKQGTQAPIAGEQRKTLLSGTKNKVPNKNIPLAFNEKQWIKTMH